MQMFQAEFGEKDTIWKFKGGGTINKKNPYQKEYI